MTYVVITEEGKAESRPGAPTPDDLIRLVGDGLPELHETTTRGLVFWTNENFMAQEDAGRLRRNVVGSIVAIGTGGNTQPYSGPLIFTGLSFTPLDGYGPADLGSGLEMALLEMTKDVRAVVENDGPADHIPDHVQVAFRESAKRLREPYPDVRLAFIGPEDLLRLFDGR